MSHSRRQFAYVLGALVSSHVASAQAVATLQTVAGRVVHATTRKVLHPAGIALLDDSAFVRATAHAEAGGVFYLDVPRPGQYRALFVFGDGSSFLSGAVAVDSGATVQREFPLETDAAGGVDSVFFSKDVTKSAAPLALKASPLYPESMRVRRIGGRVISQFVISADGKVDKKSIHILATTEWPFADAVRRAIERMKFTPGERDGVRVAQAVVLPVDFATDASGGALINFGNIR